MLPNPTLDKLQTLRLHGMIKALGEQHATPDINDLSFDERLGLMVDRELTEREDARLTTRLKAARLHAITPAWKTSTTAARAARTRR